jgi:hypothetical protein
VTKVKDRGLRLLAIGCLIGGLQTLGCLALLWPTAVPVAIDK